MLPSVPSRFGTCICNGSPGAASPLPTAHCPLPTALLAHCTALILPDRLNRWLALQPH
jgi:hypothetical protein